MVPSEGVSPPRKSAEHNSILSASPACACKASSMEPQQISSSTATTSAPAIPLLSIAGSAQAPRSSAVPANAASRETPLYDAQQLPQAAEQSAVRPLVATGP